MTESYPRIAVVTGATSGIGEATARRFVQAGYAVLGNGRNADKLAALESECGPAFRGLAGDAADQAVQAAVLAKAEEYFGRPADLVVVNAGRGLGGSALDTDLAQFEAVLHINVTAALGLMQKAAQVMLPLQAAGYPDTAADIVVIGSVVGRHVSPFSAVYGASKFAIHSLTESLRRDIGPKGIRVSLIEPAVVLTGFQQGAGYTDSMVAGFQERFGPLLVGADVAEAIYGIVALPAHVHISDVMIRPTRQDYP